MSRVHRLIAVLTLSLFFWHVQCVKARVRQRPNATGDGDSDQRHRADAELSYKLETAPIPAVHDGPQPLKIETRSAPIALDNRYNTAASKYVELERVNRHISASNSPNPQRPTGWNGIIQQSDKNIGDGIGSSHFNHPGHSQMSNNYPSNAYNYYNSSQIYGSAYQYGSEQTFKGYRETKNIGIVPPKHVNARDYYNSISGLKNLPVIGQHTNELFQSLYGNKPYLNHTHMYGYGGRDRVKNAYRNVLTGLVMWNIMNGLTNGKRYTIHDHKSLPKNISTNITITNDTVTSCFEDAAVLCGKHAEPLCTGNGTAYCVTSEVVPCPNQPPGNTCVNTSLSCDDCEDVQVTYLQCAANLTVLADDSLVEDANTNSDGEDIVLCVTSLMVPVNVEQIPCDTASCLESVAEETGNNTGNTTNIE